MSVMRGDPFKDLERMREEMDRLFSDFFSRRPRRITGEFWEPLVDMYETENDLLIRAELPGIKKEDVSLTLSGDTLTIKGERKRELELKEEAYHRLERWYGPFQRIIDLPVEVDPDKAEATYKDGILEVKIPKTEAAKAREIKVRVA